MKQSFKDTGNIRKTEGFSVLRVQTNNFLTICLCFILFTCYGAAQERSKKEAHIWYFGIHAGLDFNFDPPKVLINGATATDEGVATICDTNGRLLFYTEGMNVWNRNHVLMPNGTGLLGDVSSTQSGVIVPKPENYGMYYIFTVDEKGGPDGLRYSEVDMSLDGGQGDITSVKNFKLHFPTTEKITAVMHKNKTDVWVISHEYNSNIYIAYLITKDGVNPLPVVSSVGISHVGEDACPGYLKTSPNGQKLAAAIFLTNTVELFDFDNETGEISNPITLQSASYNKVYGLEFSLNGKRLYIATDVIYGKLFQFNLDLKNQADIEASAIEIAVDPETRFGSLQIAPNGKIYLARKNVNYLGVINNTNALGLACDYQQRAVNLLSGECRYGLPTFNQSYFNIQTEISSNSPICDGEDLELYSTQIDSAKYEWTGPNNFSSDKQNPVIQKATSANSGEYKLTVTDPAGKSTTEKIDVVINEKPLADAGSDQTACLGKSIVIGKEASGGGGIYYYSWIASTGANPAAIATPSVSPTEKTIYTVIVTDQNGCKDTASVTVDVVNPMLDFLGVKDTLDFGIIRRGSSKEMQFSAHNISGISAQFTAEIPTIGANFFEIATNPFIQEFDIDEVRNAVLKFKGSNNTGLYVDSLIIRDTCGKEWIIYLKAEVKAIIVRTSVYIPNSRAASGEEVLIPLMLQKSENLYESEIREFETTISFNKTLLYPNEPNLLNDIINGNKREITIHGSWNDTSNILYNMKYISALGNSECTKLDIIDFKWKGVDYIIEDTIDGEFCIDNICPEGGKRLINPEGEILLSSIVPNPAGDNMEIELSLIESGSTRLFIINTLGEKVLTIIDRSPELGNQVIKVDTRSIAPGVYFIVLQTPTMIITKRIEIIK